MKHIHKKVYLKQIVQFSKKIEKIVLATQQLIVSFALYCIPACQFYILFFYEQINWTTTKLFGSVEFFVLIKKSQWNLKMKFSQHIKYCQPAIDGKRQISKAVKSVYNRIKQNNCDARLVENAIKMIPWSSSKKEQMKRANANVHAKAIILDTKNEAFLLLLLHYSFCLFIMSEWSSF